MFYFSPGVSGIQQVEFSSQERALLWEMIGQLDLSSEESGLLKSIIGLLELPKSFSLSQNYPNPFDPSTTISYAIPEVENMRIRIEVYNLRGQLIKLLVD